MLYMDRMVTWDALQKEILEKMRHLLRPGVYIQVGAGSCAEATFLGKIPDSGAWRAGGC